MAQIQPTLDVAGDALAEAALAPVAGDAGRRSRVRIPGWLRLMLRNPKARVGLTIVFGMVLLGLELATGNFALLPPAVAAGEIRIGQLLRSWFWVYLGNLAGSTAYALLFYLAITNCGTNNGGPLGDLVRAAAQKKTIGYLAMGGAGWATASDPPSASPFLRHSTDEVRRGAELGTDWATVFNPPSCLTLSAARSLRPQPKPE